MSRFASRVNVSDSLFNTPQNQEVVQAELPRMAVVPCNSDVLCTHKTRLLLLYTDVQQWKMVQMLAQPPDFAIYIYSSDAFTFPLKNKLYEILFVRRV